MSLVHEESVIKRVIGDVVRQCELRGHEVSKPLASFMVKAALLDPRNGFKVDQTLTEKDIKRLKELCLDKLTAECSLSLDTIKMQVYFDTNYTSRREFLKEIHAKVEWKVRTLRREITESRVTRREEQEALYRKIVWYILLRSGMGSPTDADAEQEATAALQSIFPQTHLGAFMVLFKKDKENQLNELAMIVTGIRLFNNAGKTEAEESGLQELLNAAVNEDPPVTCESIESELGVSQNLAWKYTSVLEKLTDPKSPPEGGDVPTAPLKEALYNVRQHEVFLKMILDHARLCRQNVEGLEAEMSPRMKNIQHAVASNTVAQTAMVFPHFKALAKQWCELQVEAELLNILNKIRHGLRPFLTSQASLFSEAYLDGLLEASEVKTDQEVESSEEECVVPAEMQPQEWLLPETTTNFDELMLQFNGACGYTLVTRDGLLLPGNPHIGVLKHDGKLYAFSSKEAALKFACKVDHFVAEVSEVARRCPELIQLLKLQQQLSFANLYSEIQADDSFLEPIAMCESGTQTEIHPLEANIVKTYEWNEWELRRKAIKLADLTAKVTHSTQTELSHMRRENVSQTWLPKNVGCQSKRDGGSNVPKPQVYLAGLRGRRDAAAVKVTLTRSVDE